MGADSNKCHSDQTMHIAFCVNEKYVPYVMVPIKGIIDNMRPGKKVCVHILTDGISDLSKRRLARLFDQSPDIEHIVYKVDGARLDGLVVRHYTILTWYRMLLPDLLPDVKKILYIDTDVAVNADLSALDEVDMTGLSIATPMDTDTFIDEPFARCGYPKEYGYVCVGIMLMHLDYWREHDLARKVIDWGREHYDVIKYPDQDSINYVCRDSKGYIPLRYGVTKSLFTQPWFYTAAHAEEMRHCVDSPAIVHYAGCAPWTMECDHPHIDIWRKYNGRLERPAKRHYATKGMVGLKVRLWDMLHPGADRAVISKQEIRRRLDAVTG